MAGAAQPDQLRPRHSLTANLGKNRLEVMPTALNLDRAQFLVPIEVMTSDLAIRAFQASQHASRMAS